MRTTKEILRELELRRLERREWVEDASAATPSFREVCERNAEVCRIRIEVLKWVLGDPEEES